MLHHPTVQGSLADIHRSQLMAEANANRLARSARSTKHSDDIVSRRHGLSMIVGRLTHFVAGARHVRQHGKATA